jgi:hypothetical protein
LPQCELPEPLCEADGKGLGLPEMRPESPAPANSSISGLVEAGKF